MDGRLKILSGPGVGAHPVQCVAPDHNQQLGGSGALETLAAAANHETSAVTKDAVLIVSIPTNATIAVRIGVDATAVSTDQPYYGANVWHFPIANGERASFHNAGTVSATIGISLAQ